MKPKTKRFFVAIFCTGWLCATNVMPTPFIQAQTETGLSTGGFLRRGSDCDRVAGSAVGQASGPTSFLTRVTLAVRGNNFGGPLGVRFVSATSNASIIEQQPGENGAINAVTSHVFEINGRSDGDGKCEPGEDCFTTLDRAVLTPTDKPGNFRLTSKLGIINGFGAFRKACGRLEVRRGGAIDFTATPPTVRWEVEGNLCQCEAF
jgi:hypothetical protein